MGNSGGTLVVGGAVGERHSAGCNRSGQTIELLKEFVDSRLTNHRSTKANGDFTLIILIFLLRNVDFTLSILIRLLNNSDFTLSILIFLLINCDFTFSILRYFLKNVDFTVSILTCLLGNVDFTVSILIFLHKHMLGLQLAF